MVSVSPRVSLYMIVNDRIQLRRYTIVIRSRVIRRNAVVNDRIFPVYGRIRSFTESVTFDLGWYDNITIDLCQSIRLITCDKLSDDRKIY